MTFRLLCEICNNHLYLVIKNKEVIGSYTNECDAIIKTLEQGIKMDDFFNNSKKSNKTFENYFFTLAIVYIVICLS